MEVEKGKVHAPEIGHSWPNSLTRAPGVECFAFTFGTCVAEEA